MKVPLERMSRTAVISSGLYFAKKPTRPTFMPAIGICFPQAICAADSTVPSPPMATKTSLFLSCDSGA
ncbi:MAG: hypothetical protein FWF67_01130 [Fibromonadales bacterium]|nr:hypothetical protein [Fibromonadales bacterium]